MREQSVATLGNLPGFTGVAIGEATLEEALVQIRVDPRVTPSVDTSTTDTTSRCGASSLGRGGDAVRAPRLSPLYDPGEFLRFDPGVFLRFARRLPAPPVLPRPVSTSLSDVDGEGR